MTETNRVPEPDHIPSTAASWSEDKRRGYANGYNAAKTKMQAVMKRALEDEHRKRIDICRVYPYNLVMDLREDSDSEIMLEHDISLRAVRETMNAALTEREQRVLEMRYSWDMRLDECGKELNVTRERIRQIEERAIHKLRNPKYMRMMMCVPLSDFVKADADKQRLSEENEYLKQKIEELTGTQEMQNTAESIRNATGAAEPIDTLDLSIRSYNCLKRAGINVVGDITKLHMDDLHRIRNLGVRSAQEIIDKLAERGLTLAH